MKKTYYYWLMCGLPLILSALLSCSGMNDLHDPWLKDGEIIYTGKVDYAQIFAGENRVLLRYYTSDPKAKNLMVYWDLGTESRHFTIPEKNAEDPVEVYLDDLEEGAIHVELFTLNEQMQNQSVPYHTDGNVYGNMFKQSLVDRKIKSAVYDTWDGSLTIEWYSADARAIGCEIKYTNLLNLPSFRSVPVNESVTVIEDASATVDYLEYRTIYLPEPEAIDLFYTDYRVADFTEPDPEVNITAKVLKNAQHPFVAGDPVIGNYYLAADWKISSNMASNGNVNGGLLMLIAWSGDTPVTSITNAKLYQTVELDAGKYKFSVNGVGLWGGYTAYLVAALGSDLPDTSAAPSALASVAFPAGYNDWLSTSAVFEVEFTLSATSTVSLGFVANITSAQIAFRGSIELWRINN